jgi:TRAP-type uncharacterized transport system fused permease subunit
MVIGFSPTISVFWATIVAAACSLLRVDCTLIPYDVLRGRTPIVKGLWHSGLVKALEAGSIGVLSVAATCASAGIIVGVVTLTGLGLKFSSIVLQYADGGTRLVYDGLVALGLIALGVANYAAHMFIFYYAVLSEVSPPTALSPFAAAAITGGDPYRTTMQSWKYTMPAFLVPFMFVLDPSGLGLLLMGSFKKLDDADWVEVAVVSGTAMIGIAALAGAMQNFLFRKTTVVERGLLVAAGLALVYPKAWLDWVGLALLAVVVVSQYLRRSVPQPVAR